MKRRDNANGLDVVFFTDRRQREGWLGRCRDMGIQVKAIRDGHFAAIFHGFINKATGLARHVINLELQVLFPFDALPGNDTPNADARKKVSPPVSNPR